MPFNENGVPLPERKVVGLQKFTPAITKFFKEQWPDDVDAKTPHYDTDFDISDPKIADMKNVQSGNFEITNFHTAPAYNNPERSTFHFNVGNTEFHIQGKAADRIYELMEEENETEE